jgi:hypothetical protein
MYTKKKKTQVNRKKHRNMYSCFYNEIELKQMNTNDKDKFPWKVRQAFSVEID